ncbi:MAG: potassium channel family protein [Planctomycetota bacterium]|jgi:hypothetical protein
MIFQRENQRISASEILEAMAGGQAVKLHRCTITGELDVNRLFVKDENFDSSNLNVSVADEKMTLTLPEPITFDSCTFEDNVLFASPWDRPGKLEVVFKKDVVFNSSVFGGQTRFSKTLFCAIAGFDGCVFNRIAAFRSAIFCGQAKYRTVAFKGYGLFNDSVFRTEAGFTNSCFSKGGNFTNVRFEGKADFAGVYSESKSVPIYEFVWFARRHYGDDETFWRFIKQASQEAGYYQLAGESFYNERCAHFWRKFRGPNYDSLSSLQKFGRIVRGVRLLPELALGKWLFGYGERPVRVLVASLLIIFVCGLFYSSPYAEISYRAYSGTPSRSFMDGLYFSTITFTTLGFGDIYPAYEHLLTRCIAMAEAVSGACLMALFVVALSKRYSRG